MPNPPLVSTNANTCWLLLAGQAEPRHLSDIVVAVQALRERGVPDANIFVFAEHQLLARHLTPYGVTRVFPARALVTEAPKIAGFELAVLVVTGHGDGAGISMNAGGSMNPAGVLAAVRSCPGIKAGVVVLCQCFAGLFHYADADKVPGAADLCVLGATNLNPSLSFTSNTPAFVKKADGSPAFPNWEANVFMFRLFEWLVQPQDVDGDGLFTLMDAHKHAGVKSNDDLRDVKRRQHAAIGELESNVLRKVRELTSAMASQDPQRFQNSLLALVAADELLSSALENLHLLQEPWILNARLAKQIEFPRPVTAAAAAQQQPATGAPSDATAPASAPAPAPVSPGAAVPQTGP